MDWFIHPIPGPPMKVGLQPFWEATTTTLELSTPLATTATFGVLPSTVLILPGPTAGASVVAVYSEAVAMKTADFLCVAFEIQKLI